MRTIDMVRPRAYDVKVNDYGMFESPKSREWKKKWTANFRQCTSLAYERQITYLSRDYVCMCAGINIYQSDGDGGLHLHEIDAEQASCMHIWDDDQVKEVVNDRFNVLTRFRASYVGKMVLIHTSSILCNVSLQWDISSID